MFKVEDGFVFELRDFFLGKAVHFNHFQVLLVDVEGKGEFFELSEAALQSDELVQVSRAVVA